DTTRLGPPAAFTVSLPEGLTTRWSVGEQSSLQFLLMPTDAMPGPRRAPADSAARDSTAQRRDRPRPPRPDPDAPKPPIDLTVEVTDANGVTARVPLSRYGAVRRPLETYILRRRDVERQRYARLSEIVLQTYSIPLADFRREAPTFDPRRIASVRFVFDRAVAGTVIIDDIGFGDRIAENGRE